MRFTEGKNKKFRKFPDSELADLTQPKQQKTTRPRSKFFAPNPSLGVIKID